MNLWDNNERSNIHTGVSGVEEKECNAVKIFEELIAKKVLNLAETKT